MDLVKQGLWVHKVQQDLLVLQDLRVWRVPKVIREIKAIKVTKVTAEKKVKQVQPELQVLLAYKVRKDQWVQ